MGRGDIRRGHLNGRARVSTPTFGWPNVCSVGNVGNEILREMPALLLLS